MSYTRVIPRDFFNEAKLLKCMGQLSLKVLDNMTPEGMSITIDDNGAPFEIRQDESDGSITVSNYEVLINDRVVSFYTKLNARDAFPFYCDWSDGEETLVFDEKGEFTEEFCNLKIESE